MRTLVLLLAYDGTSQTGWTGVRDSILRPTLSRILGGEQSDLRVEAASRTDAGVHAHGQCASLLLPESSSKELMDAGQLAYSLNQLLPPEVAVRRAVIVDGRFDVRSNTGKRYEYRFNTAPCRDPLTRLHEWSVPTRRGQAPWDAERAAAFAAQLRGRHSFAAFGNTPRGRERAVEVDPICQLEEVILVPAPSKSEGEASSSWRVVVRGDRFLYKMVRNLVGAIVRVGSGELTSDECLEALEAGKFARSASVPLTAPAHGLCLRRVEYAEAQDPFAEVLLDPEI